jgi:hypothetical protein
MRFADCERKPGRLRPRQRILALRARYFTAYIVWNEINTMWYSAAPLSPFSQTDFGNLGNYTGSSGCVENNSVAGSATLRTSSMAKGMTIAGLVIAVLIFILFGMDLVLKIPFKRASLPMDVAFVICAAGLAFLSWSTLRDFD